MVAGGSIVPYYISRQGKNKAFSVINLLSKMQYSFDKFVGTKQAQFDVQLSVWLETFKIKQTRQYHCLV